MTARFWVLPLAAIMLSGCSRSGSSPAISSNGGYAVTNSPADTSPGAFPPSPTVAARAENGLGLNVEGETDPFLTAELQNFIQQKNRLPVSFAEFAGLRLDSIPRPPAGKKWVIDRADLQVKAVVGK